MLHLSKSVQFFAKYVRVEFCSRCDFRKEFERLEDEIMARDKSVLIQGIQTSLSKS